MLPDLRVLFLATVTTFLFTVGAGLFTSVRLLPESLGTAQPDRDTPISRVALSWQDVNRMPPMRDLTPAVIRDDASDAPVAKAEDRPFTPPAAPNAAPGSPPAESLAVKSEPAPESSPAIAASNNPASTGTIAETPSPPPFDQSKLAARSDPAEATTHAPPPVIAAAIPVRPKVKKARTQARRHAARRVLPQPGPSAPDPGTSFFTDFGSRVR